MGAISPNDYPDFERWIIENYKWLFTKWEEEASQYLDFDEWLEMEDYSILNEYKRIKRGE